ncbi:MAG: glycosyltransferase family 4 protein, partial [Candidatus Woesebacteria bacterium]|nr:glycosyltransferase family 4 protein [Candidatus Woesebacteria bacterium]
MNVLILNWRDPKNPKSGGAELVTHEHARAWVKAGHEVTWFTSSFPGSQSEEVVDGVFFVRRGNSFTVYFFAPLYYFFSGKKFNVIIDEIHGLPFFTPLYARIPKVAFIHEIAGEIWDYMFSFPKNVIGKLLERWYFRVYKHCLFWTDAPSTAKEISQWGIPRSQCIAISCPVICNLTPRPRPKETTPVYLFVSRVVRMKGIEEVIKAFSFILREQRDSRLWIIGGGDD